MRLPGWFLTLALPALILGCAREDGSGPGVPMADDASLATAISAPPWLRDRLPAGTIAYARLPSLWGFLSAPNGKAADAMFASRAHAETIGRIQEAIRSQPILAEVLDDATADEVIRAVSAIAGPIEIAVIAPGRTATPAAQLLLSAPLDTTDSAAASRHLRALTGAGNDRGTEFDSKGFAELELRGAPTIAHFNSATGRLHLLGGTNAGADRLQQLLDEIEANPAEALPGFVLEREIDQGGQGLVVWLDTQSVKPWLMASLTPDRLWMRHVFEQTQALAYGWGSVNGHGRLSVRAQLKDPVWQRYLPRAQRRLNIRSSGTPTFVFALALPVAEDIQRILEAVGEDHGHAAVDAWRSFDASLEKQTGLTLTDWLRPFGPELVLFGDDAGFFSAVRLHDADAWNRVLDTLAEIGGAHTVRRFGSTDIHHLSWRSIAPPPPGMGTNPAAAFIGWLQQLPSHAYWIQEDDWLVVASVPQPLIDRATLGAQQPIDAWLERTQGQDRSQALVSLSGQSRDLARWFYHGYLGLLASLGDIVGSPPDLFALPSARQLGLPRDTGIGMQLIADGQRLALDINYEHVALDGVLDMGGAYTGVAVAGILASIAVPAYQDYTTRAKVADALAATVPLKIAIVEHYAKTGELPDANDLSAIVDAAPTEGTAEIAITEGAIVIRFHDRAGAELAGRHLYLLPYALEDGLLRFACGNEAMPTSATALVALDDAIATDIADTHLPSICRG